MKADPPHAWDLFAGIFAKMLSCLPIYFPFFITKRHRFCLGQQYAQCKTQVSPDSLIVRGGHVTCLWPMRRTRTVTIGSVWKTSGKLLFLIRRENLFFFFFFFLEKSYISGLQSCQAQCHLPFLIHVLQCFFKNVNIIS